MNELRVSRRSVLKAMLAGAGLAVAAPATRLAKDLTRPALPRTGARPFPALPAGTDTLPQIDHIVILMMENHSYDNYFGLLGRGDGFTLDPGGLPTAACPDPSGRLVRAYHAPNLCQAEGGVRQSWDASHRSWNNGANDGFVIASSRQAMAYFTGTDLPFYYGLARAFPVCDRYFASTMASTYPNRRFLQAGTALGQVANIMPSLADPPPPNGTIFDRLAAHGISWKDYYVDLPSVALFPYQLIRYSGQVVPVANFLVDAAQGSLPAVSLVDPDSKHGTEESPQNIAVGAAFAAKIINAVLSGPGWAKTLLILTYDEHGGYYDHVPPPAAVAPDAIPPAITVPPNLPGDYRRYGFRVPAVIVSPWARPNYVSHAVHDHTSILKLIETKWNLPPFTQRDAQADNLLDSLDFTASTPPFLVPPRLPAPNLDPANLTCLNG